MKNILVVSAHPDDEILGAGGTLIRHRERGDKIAWLVVTNIHESGGFEKERVEEHQHEIDTIAKKLNMKAYKLDYPAMHLSGAHLNEMIPRIAELFNEFKPERIYVLNRSDAHSDHRVVFDAVNACTKSFRHPYLREVMMYECISETEFTPALAKNNFIPNCFIDVSEQIKEKIKLMNIYSSEMGVHPFPRSEKNIRALATFRGATAGVEYAEAFQILKSYRFEEL